MAENMEPAVPVKSKREMLSERLKKKYPEKEYADDESLFGQVNEDYDAYDKELGEYKDREGRLSDLISKDPRSAAFLSDMAKGNDPWISLIERIGIDGITDLMNDPEKQEDYAAANKKYVERLAKEKSLEEEYRKNLSESMRVIEQLQSDRQLSDEMLDAAMDFIMQITHDAILGKFTASTIDMALKAVNHDADVQNARTEGTVAGRNAKIDEKLRKPTTGDGTPNLAGSNNAPTRQGKKTLNIFDYADAAK